MASHLIRTGLPLWAIRIMNASSEYTMLDSVRSLEDTPLLRSIIGLDQHPCEYESPSKTQKKDLAPLTECVMGYKDQYDLNEAQTR